MPRHDLQCSNPACALVEWDVFYSPWPDFAIRCSTCYNLMEILWSRSSADIPHACHPSESVVVWEHPVTGQVRYPGRNDTPIPERYQREGFVRKEIRTLRDIHKFESDHKVLNERAWFDRGSGRDFTGD